MSKYQIFIALFILSVVAFFTFISIYMNNIFLVMPKMMDQSAINANPFYMFSLIFTPAVITSFIIGTVVGLTLMIYGIVLVAKNKQVKDGERALWIVGFILMCFVTSIVFLVMAKGRKFVD